MDNYELTVILATYNRDKMLRNAIDSVLSQTYQNFRLIIYDNASTDKTEEVVKEAVDRDKRVSYIKRNKNIGVFGNFQNAIDECKSEYFAFMCDDDLMNERLLEKEIEFMKTHCDVDIVGTNCRFIDEKGNISPVSRLRLYKDYLIWDKGEYHRQEMNINKLQFFASGFVARTKNIQASKIRLDETDDCGWIEGLNLSGCKIGMLSEPLYYYRVQGDNSSNREIIPVISNLENRLITRKKYGSRNELISCYEYMFSCINTMYLELKTVHANYYNDLENMLDKSINWLSDIFDNGLQECLYRNTFQRNNIVEKLYVISLICQKKWSFDIKFEKEIEGISAWERLVDKQGEIIKTILKRDDLIGIFGSGFNSLAITLLLKKLGKDVVLYFDNNYEDSFDAKGRAKIVNPNCSNLKEVDTVIISNLYSKSVNAVTESINSYSEKTNIIWWQDLL